MSSLVQFVKRHPYLAAASTVLVIGGVIYYADMKGACDTFWMSIPSSPPDLTSCVEKERQEQLHKERVAKNREESRKREELRRKKAQEEAERKLEEAHQQEEEESSLETVA